MEELNISRNKYSINLMGRLRQIVKKEGSTTIESIPWVGNDYGKKRVE